MEVQPTRSVRASARMAKVAGRRMAVFMAGIVGGRFLSEVFLCYGRRKDGRMNISGKGLSRPKVDRRGTSHIEVEMDWGRWRRRGVERLLGTWLLGTTGMDLIPTDACRSPPPSSHTDRLIQAAGCNSNNNGKRDETGFIWRQSSSQKVHVLPNLGR